MEHEPMGAREPLTPAERQFLIDSGAPADSFNPEATEAARARLRAYAEQTRRNASPELTAEQVASLLGCSRSQVVQWAESQDLYAYDFGDGQRFPEWQFPDGQKLAGMAMVLRELGPQMHPNSVEGLLADVPHEELDDMTAVQWLTAGGTVGPVIQLAKSTAYDM